MDLHPKAADPRTGAEPRGADEVDGDIYPLSLEPLLVERLWGADRLGELHGLTRAFGAKAPGAPRSRTGSPRTPIGESWLLCDDNLVRNGRFAGRRVADVITALGGRLLGTANLEAYGTKLALMAKLLDAAADLSIQVHPDDAYALAHESATGHLGKSEAWYVLDAAEGAGVVWGFRDTMTQAAVRAAVADGSLASHLNRVPVRAGDVVVNPAGTVHAVGAGLLLFEIQQSSDLTYRLYDYARRDAAGNLRELHLDKALAVADLRAADPAVALEAAAAAADASAAGEEAGWRLLVTTPQFSLESALVGTGARPVAQTTAAPRRATMTGLLTCTTSDRTFDLLVAASGQVEVRPLRHEGGTAAPGVVLRLGDAVLLPAALGPYGLSGSGEVLRSRVGDGPLPGQAGPQAEPA